MIHRTFDPPHQNCRSLSFVALERSSVPDMATPTGDDEVLTSRKSRRKHTSREITDAERFQGARTSRHQPRHRREVSMTTCHPNLREVETAREVQQSTRGGADPDSVQCAVVQVKGSGES